MGEDELGRLCVVADQSPGHKKNVTHAMSGGWKATDAPAARVRLQMLDGFGKKTWQIDGDRREPIRVPRQGVRCVFEAEDVQKYRR